MSLPTETLVSIQTAGAAISAASAELRKSAEAFGLHVQESMRTNPFEVGNDATFEEWKVVARLAQTVGTVEAEFQRIYHQATQIGPGGRPARSAPPALAAPAALPVTDIETVAPRKPGPKPKKNAKGKALSGNTAKLQEHLATLLNHTDFVKLNQSAVAQQIGLAKGSIGASIAKLTKTRYLVKGPTGGFKLR